MITTKALIAARKSLGLSQNAFAAKLGVDQSTVWAWEKRGLPKNTMILDSVERRVAELLEAASKADAA